MIGGGYYSTTIYISFVDSNMSGEESVMGFTMDELEKKIINKINKYTIDGVDAVIVSDIIYTVETEFCEGYTVDIRSMMERNNKLKQILDK